MRMRVWTRTMTWLAGFWLAAAVVHVTPSPAAGSDAPEWSAGSRLPDVNVVHRTRAHLRAGLVLGTPAVLPAPLSLVAPQLHTAPLTAPARPTPLDSFGGSLGARAPPV
jgi:hypothetical protein